MSEVFAIIEYLKFQDEGFTKNLPRFRGRKDRVVVPFPKLKQVRNNACDRFRVCPKFDTFKLTAHQLLLMKSIKQGFFFIPFFLLAANTVFGQLQITPNDIGNELAQKLVGDGVAISDVVFKGNIEMAGFFKCSNGFGNTNIGIDSGIVLTNGVASARNKTGVAGASSQTASNAQRLPGDGDLSAVVLAATHDACVLEFNFVPLGDSVRFNYVFSSDEYPTYACSEFNDAFAFFISGPGFPGLTNIALIPNTTDPVTIHNINDQTCGVYPQFYINNQGNQYFTHNGLTKVLTAACRVQPCQSYHLKLVIADVSDDVVDSGVFLEAKSLSSNAVTLTNVANVDQSGNSFIAEGCNSFPFVISRPKKDPVPLNVTLAYGGTATNGVDVQLLPLSVIIPANDSFVTVNITAIQDNLPEGVEKLKIYALSGCSNNIPSDSIIVEIRDFDALALVPDTALICNRSSIPLNAATGYTTYQWDPDPTLSSTTIHDPVATPVNELTTYICTATNGTCKAKDSALIQLKVLHLLLKKNVNCSGAATGVIRVSGGPKWTQPVEYALDGGNWQADSTFANLPAGTYWVKVRDAFCIDSIPVTVTQAFPDLAINNTDIINASCSGNPDGVLTVNATGGSNPLQYSLDNINFQGSNIFNVTAGNYTIYIKDNSGCSTSSPVTVPLNNTVTLDAGPDGHICSGREYQMQVTSNGDSYAWTPAGSLNDPTTKNPIATPDTYTKYYVTAATGICNQRDSMEIFVRPSPVADAGDDIRLCFGQSFTLNGSGGVTYSWSPSTYLTTPADIPDPSGRSKKDISYFLTVTDATGCTSLTPDEVKVVVIPTVKIFAGHDTVVAMNQPLQLHVAELSNAGVTQYQWTPAGQLSNSGIANPITTLTADEHFYVTGTTPDGCTGTDDIIVKVYKGPDIYVPTGFTPNNDGKNDILKAIPVGIRQFNYFIIYNRWGQVIFRTEDYTKGWDGRINGVTQQTGTYIWVTEGIDYLGNPVSRKGVVVLIR